MIPPRRPGLSFGALFVCGAVALTSRHPVMGAAFRDPYAEAMFAGAAADGVAPDDWLERFEPGCPGVVTHVVYRKRWVEEKVRAFLDGGGERVVVLGAGLDTLSLRLHAAYPKTLFIEIDHPDSQAVKRRLVQDLAGRPANIRFVGGDLTPEGVSDWLDRTVPPVSGRTLVLAEAVIEYLPVPAAVAMFGFMRRMSGPGGRCLFTFLSSKAERLPNLDGVTPDAGTRNDRYRFLIDPAGLDRFLAQRALRRLDHLDPERVRDELLPSLGLAGLVQPLAGMHFVEATSAVPVA